MTVGGQGANCICGFGRPRGKTVLPISFFVVHVQQSQALPAGYRGAMFRGDAFHLGSMSGLLVARIAQDHAVCVQGMEIVFLSFERIHSSFTSSFPRAKDAHRPVWWFHH